MAFKRRTTSSRSGRFAKRRRMAGSFSRRPRFLRSRRPRASVPGLTPESKFVDYAFSNAALAVGGPNGVALYISNQIVDASAGGTTVVPQQNAGVTTPQVGIPGGSGYNQRIGRKIFLKYISIRALVKPVAPATFTPSVQNFRIVLLYDRQPNLALPGVGDIFQEAAGLTVLAFHEDKNRDRFVTLWDYTNKVTRST